MIDLDDDKNQSSSRTTADYVDAAIEMLRNGEKPTVRALVNELGGSQTTAQEGLNSFWDYVVNLTDYRREYPTAVPRELSELLEELLLKARKTAEDDLARQRDEFEKDKQEFSEQKAAEALRKKELELELGKTSKDLQVVSGRVSEQEKEKIDLIVKVNTLQGDYAKLNEKANSLANRLDSEIQKSEEHEHSLGTLKEEHKNLDIVYTKAKDRLAALTPEIDALTEKLAVSQAESSELRETLNGSEREVESLRVSLSASETKLNACEQSLIDIDKDLHTKSHELDVAAKSNDLLAAENKKLVKGLGKAEAYEEQIQAQQKLIDQLSTKSKSIKD